MFFFLKQFVYVNSDISNVLQCIRTRGEKHCYIIAYLHNHIAVAISQHQDDISVMRSDATSAIHGKDGPVSVITENALLQDRSGQSKKGKSSFSAAFYSRKTLGLLCYSIYY